MILDQSTILICCDGTDSYATIKTPMDLHNVSLRRQFVDTRSARIAFLLAARLPELLGKSDDELAADCLATINAPPPQDR